MKLSRKDLPVLPNGRNVVGIDIGKKRHAAVGLKITGEKAGPEMWVENSRAGIDRLEKMLLTPLGGPKHVIIE